MASLAESSRFVYRCAKRLNLSVMTVLLRCRRSHENSSNSTYDSMAGAILGIDDSNGEPGRHLSPDWLQPYWNAGSSPGLDVWLAQFLDDLAQAIQGILELGYMAFVKSA